MTGDPKVYWHRDACSSVINVVAEPPDWTTKRDDLFDLAAVRDIATIVRPPQGGEHLLLTDGSRHLQLQVTKGSVLEGPVRFRCTLNGMRDIEQKVLALRRLCLCHRLGRLPRSLYPPEPQAGRWIDKLRTVDAIAAGASHREIAAVLFGERRTAAEWSRASDYLRLRVQRLVRDGTRLVQEGYKELLA